MDIIALNKYPHRRRNLLTGEWILVSPQRSERPWQGQEEDQPVENIPAHDVNCYLCPGNQRANGIKNPNYQDTFVFDNDFAALLPEIPSGVLADGGLLVAKAEKGICRVVCFSPRHDLTIAEMDERDITKVIEVWTEQYRELMARPEINTVIVFENRGRAMGCSNPHPHGQIWATESLPRGIEQEVESFSRYRQEKKHCLLCDYLEVELQKGERLVAQNEHFVSLVPFWACWPYETLVVPRRHVSDLTELAEEEKLALAAMIKLNTVKYDNLFKTSFPYSMGLHQLGVGLSAQAGGSLHLHLHYYPPLLRSATIRKFMVGFELLAEAQRDITPERAAEVLRGLPVEHYKS